MRKFLLKTKDRQSIAGQHYSQGHPKVIVLCHGFFNNKDVHLFRGIAGRLSEKYDVVTFDFRGHGQSSGLFSWTTREGADLQAVLAYLKEFHYESVGLIGFSLGAAIGLIEAAENPEIKTVIAVSAPYDFREIDFHFWEPGMWEDLKLNLGYKGKGKGVRPGNLFAAKVAPISIVDRIAPRPILFLHGEDDWLINKRHSEILYQKAGQPKKLTIIPAGGHAEKIFDDHPEPFMRECLDWFAQTL